jgi:hypothetical protein
MWDWSRPAVTLEARYAENSSRVLGYDRYGQKLVEVVRPSTRPVNASGDTQQRGSDRWEAMAQIRSLGRK